MKDALYPISGAAVKNRHTGPWTGQEPTSIQFLDFSQRPKAIQRRKCGLFKKEQLDAHMKKERKRKNE